MNIKELKELRESKKLTRSGIYEYCDWYIEIYNNKKITIAVDSAFKQEIRKCSEELNMNLTTLSNYINIKLEG